MLKELQKILQAHGLYAGAIDGQIGLETLKALNNMTKTAAKAVQQLLADGKYYTGLVDGIFGPASYSAFNSLIPAPTLTAKALAKIYPNANSMYLQHINSEAKNWGITTKAEMCMFLANVLVESGGFNDKDLRENMNYSVSGLLKTFPKYFKTEADARAVIKAGQEAIAERVYSGRMGNGIGNGDAWKYRGGGLIQTTGKYNYSVLGKAINEDLINFTSRISDPLIATKSALYYWKSKKCGTFANRMELKECRKSINGGLHGIENIEKYFLKSWAFLF